MQQADILSLAFIHCRFKRTDQELSHDQSTMAPTKTAGGQGPSDKFLKKDAAGKPLASKFSPLCFLDANLSNSTNSQRPWG